MINEPLETTQCCHFWGMQWLLCELTWIRDRPNTLRVHTEYVHFTCRNCGGGDRGRVAIIVPSGKLSLSLNRTVTCMVLKANDRRISCPCHEEFRCGPRSDYVRQVALATTTTEIAPNATVIVVNVTMKREMSFICPQDIKNPAEEFDEEYCGQMIVVSPIVWQLHEHCWSLKLLRTQTLPFRQQCRVHVLLGNMVVRLLLDPPTFQFPQKRLTSFKRPAGFKEPFPLFTFF
ncbi:uncharacterized protein TNCV_3532081 [Trichonephila clavipes]|nr:uncharacterized protein TNCV_3532081 [Trichonephila clavipes]